MDKEQIISMDPYMLLSVTNMKLRDEFSSLDEFCLEYDIIEKTIVDKLGSIGYKYYNEKNQFISL